MTKEKIGVKPSWDDAVYRKKRISTYLIELIGGTRRGAHINLWKKATREEIDSEQRLPHIYTISTDLKWDKLSEVHFMDFENGEYEYNGIKKVSDVIDLAWRKR